MRGSAFNSLHSKPLGITRFIYVVAPHHPMATQPEPITDAVMREHRAVAVADSVQRGDGVSIGLLGGQDVFTVPGMMAKLDAQLRGLGTGFLPEYLARPYVEAGRLVVKEVSRPPRVITVSYAWCTPAERKGLPHGKAIQWWLDQLANPMTRTALLERPQRP
jgi:DNA-binding transcriptional LysR family regulator